MRGCCSAYGIGEIGEKNKYIIHTYDARGDTKRDRPHSSRALRGLRARELCRSGFGAGSWGTFELRIAMGQPGPFLTPSLFFGFRTKTALSRKN